MKLLNKQVVKPQTDKLLRSLYISVGAVGAVIALSYLFPEQDLLELKTAVVTAVSAWLINLVKESLR